MAPPLAPREESVRVDEPRVIGLGIPGQDLLVEEVEPEKEEEVGGVARESAGAEEFPVASSVAWASRRCSVVVLHSRGS